MLILSLRHIWTVSTSPSKNETFRVLTDRALAEAEAYAVNIRAPHVNQAREGLDSPNTLSVCYQSASLLVSPLTDSHVVHPGLKGLPFLHQKYPLWDFLVTE